MTEGVNLEGRRALVFLGLPHHALRLRPVLAALEARGLEMVYLTARNVPSLGEGNNACFEPGLAALGIAYRHLYDYRTEGHAEALTTRLETLAAGLEGADDEALLDLFGGIDRGWFSLAVEDAVECDLLMERVIEQERPDIVLGLHEANFWVKLLARRAALAGLPALTFQEGHYDPSESDRAKYRVMAEFSTVALWGAVACEALLAQAPEAAERLAVVGDVMVDSVLEPDSFEAEALRRSARERLGLVGDQRVALLLLPNPYDKYAEAIPIRQIADYLAGLNIDGREVRFVAKWHPRESFATIGRFRDLEDDGRLINVVEGDAREWLLASDLCLVLDSSAGLDALVLGRALAEVNFGVRRFGRSYAEAGVAEAIDGAGALPRLGALLREETRGWSARQRRAYLDRIYAAVDGEASERVVALVGRLIGRGDLGGDRHK